MIWPNTERNTCFFHLTKSLKEKFKPKQMCQYSDEIMADVSTLSMVSVCNLFENLNEFQAGSWDEFIKAARVLNNHWAARYRDLDHVREALSQFVDFYIRNADNNCWYNNGGPRTNNSLEASNRQFKERVTFHRRLPIREFLEEAPKHMRIWSLSAEHQVFL